MRADLGIVDASGFDLLADFGKRLHDAQLSHERELRRIRALEKKERYDHPREGVLPRRPNSPGQVSPFAQELLQSQPDLFSDTSSTGLK